MQHYVALIIKKCYICIMKLKRYKVLNEETELIGEANSIADICKLIGCNRSTYYRGIYNNLFLSYRNKLYFIYDKLIKY